jgi:hypothetical protein
VNNLKFARRCYWDILIALSAGLLGFWFYAHFALQLAETVYDDYLNLAFDFDPAYFLRYLSEEIVVDGAGINYKHPFWVLFRPVASLFGAIGYQPKAASALVMSLFGGLTVTLSYLFARLYGAGRAESAAATLFFACSSTTLFTAFIVESYGWVNFSLALLWCVYLLGFRQSSGYGLSRLLASSLVFGITITNIMQVGIAEFFLKCRTEKVGRAMLATMLFSIAAGLIAVCVIALFQPHDLWQALSHPLQTLRTIYWMQTKGATVGLLQLLKTFFVYSVYAPEFDRVPLSSAINMLDFRSYSFSLPVFCAAIVWLLFWVANLIFGISLFSSHKLLLPLVVAIVVNLVFHLGYQFRGSIYIYTAHLQFPIFAVSLAASPWVRQQCWRWRTGYTAIFLVLAVLAFSNNVERAQQFIDHCRAIVIPAAGDSAIDVPKPQDMYKM